MIAGGAAVVVLLGALLVFGQHKPKPPVVASDTAASSSTSAVSFDLPNSTRPSADIVGSTWKGEYRWSDGEVDHETDTFNPNSSLTYAYNGSTYDNGHWTQDGSSVSWNTNDHYADYQGQMQGDQITGTMKNKQGFTGTFSITKQ